MSMVFNKESRGPIIGGCIVTLVGLLAAILMGETTGYKAQEIISRYQNNINTLCNTVILSSSTILALLFTVLSLTSGTKVSLKKAFYHRIKQVALFDTILFTVTILVFLLLNFPIDKSDNISSFWFEVMYYVTTVSAAAIGGMIVSVILLLYYTISDLIEIVGYDASEHRLAEVQDDEEKD